MTAELDNNPIELTEDEWERIYKMAGWQDAMAVQLGQEPVSNPIVAVLSAAESLCKYVESGQADLDFLSDGEKESIARIERVMHEFCALTEKSPPETPMHALLAAGRLWAQAMEQEALAVLRAAKKEQERGPVH